MVKSYKESGVDIKKTDKIAANINKLILSTKNEYTPNFIAGHYAGIFEAGGAKLAIHTDGVGSKILVAQELGIHDTIGIDAVAMNTNDIICMGSRPIVAVDYIALSREDESLIMEVMRGLVEGCKESGMALVGGETAILPDMIKSDKKRDTADYDLAVSAVGIVENEIIDGSAIKEGDAIIGLASTGLHSNGFSLARKVLSTKDWGEEMLVPTEIYVNAILDILQGNKVNGIAHITGGAFSKVNRLASAARVGIEFDNMPKNKGIFAELEKQIKDTKELYRTFNMGVGMVLAVPQSEVENVIKIAGAHKIDAMQIGKAVKGKDIVLKKNDRKVSLL